MASGPDPGNLDNAPGERRLDQEVLPEGFLRPDPVSIGELPKGPGCQEETAGATRR
jgi:hypothetical protein